MSSRKKTTNKPAPLSETQMASPETLPPEELAQRRAGIAALAAEARQLRGQELLAEGARLLSQRRAGEAATRLAQAAELLPGNADVAINLGGAYVLQGKYDRAVQVLEQATKLAPENAMLWVNLAAAHLGRLELAGPRQQERAIAAYERALEIDPATPNVHYSLGLIHKDRQDWARARAHFTAALNADSGDADASYWLDRMAMMEAQTAGSPDPGQTAPGSPGASQGDMP